MNLNLTDVDTEASIAELTLISSLASHLSDHGLNPAYGCMWDLLRACPGMAVDVEREEGQFLFYFSFIYFSKQRGQYKIWEKKENFFFQF